MFEASRRVLNFSTSTSGFSVLDRALGRVDLGRADAVGRVDDLALEVGDVDHVVVDDAELADAGGRQVERGRRAEPAGAEQQHLRVEQLELALDADLRQQHVARVAAALLGRERARHVDVEAAVLPQRDAAGHRRDVLVAELALERVGGERRAVAGRAVQDDGLRAVAHGALDARLQVAARHVDGARDVALLELVLLAHVDDHGTVPVAVLKLIVDLARVHLLDLLLDVAEQFRAARHSSKLLKAARLSRLQKV